MELNEQQRFAIEHENGPLLILAGAGSGKTRVLTERVVHLIRNKHVHPSEILAVTFTNKAAAEMRNRIERTIGLTAREVWINTFHSACLKILRRNAEHTGLSPHFVIFDSSDQLSLIKKILIELNISDRLVTPRGAVEKISRAKDSLTTPDNYPSGDFYQGKMAEVYKRYQEELQKNGAVDFGDLIMLTVMLFRKHPEVLKHYQSKFRYILVDEYQDTNHSQYELIRMLSDKYKNISVVGDPDQSIYAWRGADISNILDFERDFEGANVIKLEQNYRSTKTILAASDAVIANNSERKPKTLWTDNEEGEPINMIEVADEREEARSVVKEIRNLTSSGILHKDIAIFYRTNAQSRVFEDEFRRERIPYVIYGGIRFYDRAEIKNIIAYLRLVINPNENVSLKRIINIPARGIGNTTVKKLEAYSSAAGVTIYEYITTHLQPPDFNSGTRQKLLKFALLVKELTELRDLPPAELVAEAVNKTRYVEDLVAERTEETNERVLNIDELISAVSEAIKAQPEMTLADFLDQVALISDIDSYNEGEDVLPLMTLHLAKGLEFPYIFIVGMEEGVLPHIRALDESAELEEERRLFYVGMTRARKKVHLAHANQRMIRGSFSYNVPSRFMDEIPEKFVLRTQCSVRSTPYALGRKENAERDDFGQGCNCDDFSQVTFEDQEIVNNSSRFALPSSPITDNRSPNTGYRVGQRVRHPTFGEGIIRKTEGKIGQQKLIIQFKTGELKNLSAQYAKLSVY